MMYNNTLGLMHALRCCRTLVHYFLLICHLCFVFDLRPVNIALRTAHHCSACY